MGSLFPQYGASAKLTGAGLSRIAEEMCTEPHIRPVAQRDRNEDAAIATLGVTPTMRRVLIAVADGMGNAPAGDRASSIAIEAAGATPMDNDPPVNLNAAVAAAHCVVHAFSQSSPTRGGSGTTLVAAYLRGHRAWLPT